MMVKKRLLYLFISIALFLLYPSLYGVRYCFISEKLIKRTHKIEIEVRAAIDKYEKSKMACEPIKNTRVASGLLVPEMVVSTDDRILSACSEFLLQGFSFEVGDYTYLVLKLKSGFTQYIEALRSNIFQLQEYLNLLHIDRRDNYCYLDEKVLERLNLTNKEISEVLDAHVDKVEYYPDAVKEKFKRRFEISLEFLEEKSQANLKDHIAKLKAYLQAIRTARLRHKPYRSTVRFIGWSWLIFEIVGMVLLLGATYVEIKARKKKKHESVNKKA